MTIREQYETERKIAWSRVEEFYEQETLDKYNTKEEFNNKYKEAVDNYFDNYSSMSSWLNNIFRKNTK